MKIFAQNLAKLAPDWVTLPPELIETFDWLEDQGWHNTREAGQPEDHYLLIYPPAFKNHPAVSHLAFGGTTLTYTGHWSTPDPDIDNRLFEFGETSGDGGRLAIWLDDEGKQQFVHLGHDTLGIITDDPTVLLQFLAMGYPEPGYLPQTNVTPIQAYLDYHGVQHLSDFAPNETPVMPTALQGFIKERYNLDMPATAHDTGITEFPAYGDATTSDAFALWITALTPAPTEAELAYEQELLRRVETLDLNDDDSSETIMNKIGTLFQSKD